MPKLALAAAIIAGAYLVLLPSGSAQGGVETAAIEATALPPYRP